MKRILFFIGLVLLSVFGYSQSTLPLRADTVRIYKNAPPGAELIIENSTKGVTGGVLTNIGNGRTAFVTPSGGGGTYTAQNAIKLSGSTFKLGDYLTENTTIKGANVYDFLIDSADAVGITHATSISLSTRAGAAGGTGSNAGQIDITGGNGGTGVTQGGNGAATILQGGDAGSGTTNGVAGYVKIAGGSAPATGNSAGGSVFVTPGAGIGSGLDGSIYLGVSPSATVRGNTVIGATSDDGTNKLQVTGGVRFFNHLNTANKDSALRVTATGVLEQYRQTDLGWTVKSGFDSLFWDKSSYEIQAKAIKITSSAGTVTKTVTDSTVEYNIPGGSGGASLGRIHLIADENSATYQNDSLIDKEIIQVSINGDVISDDVWPYVYYTFDDATGTITFHNGYITEDDYVQILFGLTNLVAGVGAFAYTPTDISGLLAWYDFSDASSLTLSSGRISQANDLSGNGNHVVQATFANMPDYDATGGGQVSFTAARSADIKKTLGAAVTGNYTLYALVRKKASETFVNSAEMFVTNSGTVTGLIEKTSTWGDGLWSGYDGTNSTNAVIFGSDDYELFRVSFMQGNAVQFHVNDEAPSRTFYTGALPGSFPSINRYHFGRLSALGSDFSIKEAIAVADDANIDTDKAVWNYMRAKHGLVSKEYLLMIGDSHTFGAQTGSGGTTGNPAYLVLTNDLGFRVYNNGINGSKAYDPSAPTDPDDFHTILDTWMVNGNPSTAWIAISYGTNDLAADIALSSWKTNFKADIQRIIDLGYDPQRIILWTPPYTTNPGYSANVNAAATKIAEIASELGCRLADVRQAMIDAGLDCYTVVGGDTIHGNDAIHAVIASTIQAQIY